VIDASSSPSQGTARGAPEWLINVSALAWRVLVVALLTAVAFFIATKLIVVTASIALAILVAAACQPAMIRLRERHWTTAKAAGVVTAAVVTGVTVVLLVTLLAFVPYVVDLIRSIQAGADAVRATAVDGVLPPEIAAQASAAITSFKEAIAATIQGIGASVALMVTIAILAAILMFFFLRDGIKGLMAVVPEGTPHRRQVISMIARRGLPSAGRYLRVCAFFATIDAIFAFVFLVLLGVPLAFPLAVVVFLGSFVPYLGLPVAIGLLAVVAMGTNSTRDAALLIAGMAAAYWLTRRYLGPRIRQEPTGMNPATLLIAILVASALVGYVGMITVVPAFIVGRAVVKAVVLVLNSGASESRPILVPGWLDRLADVGWRLLVTAALIGLAISVVALFPIVMLPLLFASIAAATFAPFATPLVKRGWSRTAAAFTATAGGIGLVVGLLALASWQLFNQAQTIATNAAQGAQDAESTNVLHDTSEAYANGAASAIGGVSLQLLAVVVVIALSALLCFYLLRDGAILWHAFLKRMEPTARPNLESIADSTAGILSGYMVGTGAISGFAAITQWATMVLLGLPLALPLAVLSFFGGFIPYIGSFITTGIAFLVTIAVGSPFDILVMFIFTFVFNLVTANVVAPIVYSRAVNVHPAITLLAIPAGNVIAGILGMFLAVPVAAIALATYRPILQLASTIPPALRAPEPIPAVAAAAPVAPPTPAPAPAPAPAHTPLDGVRRVLQRTVFRGRRKEAKA
jgi:predicted PurR-regulated permease PerM